mgnify:CR=1 FL=1
MKLRFCVLCGTTENLHHHHVIPKIKGGIDDDENLITVCDKHHHMIHNMRQNVDMYELARIGREKARRSGVKFGRKPAYEHLYKDITKLYLDWNGYGTIGRELGISRQGVKCIVKRLGLIRGSKPESEKKYRKLKNGQYVLGV